MKLTNEEKKDILDLVLGRVAAIANIEYQKRVWIQGKGPEVDDFDETACHFLHEGAGILEKYKDFEITKTQYQQLKKLRDEFRIFADENDLPEEFINSPEWKRIIDMAKNVLKSFNCSKMGGKRQSLKN